MATVVIREKGQPQLFKKPKTRGGSDTKNTVFSTLSIIVLLGLLVGSCSQASPAPTPSPEPVRPAITAPAPLPKVEPKGPAATRTPAQPQPGVTAAAAQAYYQGKTIEIIAATAAGGGTDTAARLIATFLPKYIPGNPKMVVRNHPGAGGVVAHNTFYARAKPDGTTLLVGASSAITNQQRGRDIVRYDLRKMPAIGNIGESGGIIVISKAAESRLTDPRAKPVVLASRDGTETSGLIPLYGQEFLGWNLRWLLGFGGVSEFVLAFRRGEVDMFNDTGPNAKLLTQEGLAVSVAQRGIYRGGKFVRRQDFSEVPTFEDVLGEKKPRGLAWEAYIAGTLPAVVFKYLIAPPGTPDYIVKVLVDAFDRMKSDPSFNSLIYRTLSEEYDVSTGQETERLIRESIEVSPGAADYPDSLLRKFGVIK